MKIGTRGEIHVHRPAAGSGRGTSRRWTRDINGTPYSFTAVTMPDGERRYFVSKYNGYLRDSIVSGDVELATALHFGCAWSPVHSIIVNPGYRYGSDRYLPNAGPRWTD